jgi:glycosyltransferase involved in cell wall biosynthesis
MDGVNVWYFPVPIGRRLYWSPRMAQALRQQVPSFAVVHTHSVFLWPTWAAARAAARHGVPYVVSPRGMLVADLVRKKSRLAKTAWIRLFERSNLEHAAAVHATSRIEADELMGFGMDLPPVRIVPNGVDPAPDAGSAGACSSEIDVLTIGPRYFLFIGRINWKKGLDRLIPAMAQLPEMHLLIAGNDEEAYRPVLEALAEQHGVVPQIRFIGPAYGGDKQALLRRATALVVPSYSENFGNVVLEAMSAGCPVIVTPEVGAADIVRESGAGIVVHGDPNSLAEGIKGMLSDPGLMRKMSQRGRDTVAQRYGWDMIACSMEAVYFDSAPGPSGNKTAAINS